VVSEKYKLKWSLLVLAIVCAIISFYLDCQSLKETTWFSRSGSLVVLAAAFVEFRLSKFLYDDVFNSLKKTARKQAGMPAISDSKLIQGVSESNLIEKPTMPESRKCLINYTHTLIIFGTLIWAYGDIPFK